MIWEKLSEKKLLTLSLHKYSASGQTLLDPLMQRFWRWFLERFVPLWWAPNAMTLVGLFSNIITACILVYYSPDAKQEVSHSPVVITSNILSDVCYGFYRMIRFPPGLSSSARLGSLYTRRWTRVTANRPDGPRHPPVWESSSITDVMPSPPVSHTSLLPKQTIILIKCYSLQYLYRYRCVYRSNWENRCL